MKPNLKYPAGTKTLKIVMEDLGRDLGKKSSQRMFTDHIYVNGLSAMISIRDGVELFTTNRRPWRPI